MGSNPTLSATSEQKLGIVGCFDKEPAFFAVKLTGGGALRRGVREAEGARLEIVCTPKRCIEGSNPSLSAI